MYVCMYNLYIDMPVVKITRVTTRCEYVSVSWIVAGSSDDCRPVQYDVMLSSSMINITVSITSMNTHNFTELPDDTQFTVTVIGINVMGVVSDPVSTSVITKENCMFELLCFTCSKLPYIHKYVYMYSSYMCIYVYSVAQKFYY